MEAGAQTDPADCLSPDRHLGSARWSVSQCFLSIIPPAHWLCTDVRVGRVTIADFVTVPIRTVECAFYIYGLA